VRETSFIEATSMTTVHQRKWHTIQEVAALLGFGVSKTKSLIASGQIRSIKDGHHRRVLPAWVDDYVNRRVEEYGA
jgi:excisionase family DNA binding protein